MWYLYYFLGIGILLQLIYKVYIEILNNRIISSKILTYIYNNNQMKISQIDVLDIFIDCYWNNNFEKIVKLINDENTFLFLEYSFNYENYYIIWDFNNKNKVKFPIYSNNIKSFSNKQFEHKYKYEYASLNNSENITDLITKYEGPFRNFYKDLNITIPIKFLWNPDNYDNKNIISNKKDFIEIFYNNKKKVINYDDFL